MVINKDEKAVRVLHVLTGLSAGGAESFIMNMYRNIDRSKVQFDFLLRSEDNLYKDELEKMGSRVYVTASFPRHFLKNAVQTSAFFKEHHYDIIHVHANALLYTYVLCCAKRYGVKCRIIHSHNTAMAHMQLLPIHEWNKKRIGTLATDCFACSEDAGKWMFNRDFTVINNAIDLEKFAFDPEKRAEVRASLGIKEEDLVIGHVGRFVEQKNHAFLIEVFAQIEKCRKNIKLLLVGDGILRNSIENQVKSLNLENKVIFLGTRNDTAEVINAFDLFVFPSLFEGLAIVAIEAQANGLKAVCSDCVPEEVLFTGNTNRLSLEVGPEDWAEHILNMDASRLDLTDQLRNAGYDIRQEAKKLQDFYLSHA